MTPYYRHFGLERDPFLDTADPHFYRTTPGLMRARDRLVGGVLESRGLQAVAGDPGTGKTSLMAQLERELLGRDEIRLGKILDPSFANETEFLLGVARSFGLALPPRSPAALKNALKNYLYDAAVLDGLTLALLVDEAQNTNDDVFEVLRLLLNYDVPQRKLLNVVLFGQTELRARIDARRNLADRVDQWTHSGAARRSRCARAGRAPRRARGRRGRGGLRRRRARRDRRRGRRHAAPPADARPRDAARSGRLRPPPRHAHRRRGRRARARAHRPATLPCSTRRAAGARAGPTTGAVPAAGDRRRESRCGGRSRAAHGSTEARAAQARLGLAAGFPVAGRVSRPMSDREVDVDALFDRNADTQLLDRRRREELGLVAQLTPALATPVRFGPESILADEPPHRARAAMLRIALAARPERELIPGAVVTVVASVHDDGDADAADVLLRVTLPSECEPVPGSFARDDASFDGDALLGEGVRLGTIAAGKVTRVRFALRVLPGTGPLHLIGHAVAPGIPTIAPPALRLTRRAGHAAFDPPRPFFELEADEKDDQLASIAAPPAPSRTVDTVSEEIAAPDVVVPERAVAPDVVVRERAVAADVTVAPEPVVSAEPVAEAPAVAPEPAIAAEPVVVREPVIAREPVVARESVIAREPVVAPERERENRIKPAVVIVKRAPPPEPIAPEPIAAEPIAAEPIAPEPIALERAAPKAARARPEPKPEAKPPRARKPPKPRAKKAAPEPARPHVLARTLDDETVRAVERVFTSAVPHGLAALTLLSAVAAVDSPLGDALGVRAFAHAIASAVPRALVAARMNRPAPEIVTRESLGSVKPLAPAPDESFAQYFPMLVTRLDERDLAALRTVLERDLDDTFLRGVQVLLAVVPRALEGVGAEAAARASGALAAYRVAAGAWLMRVTVRRAVDRRYDPLVANDASLHEAGRALVAALRGALA